MSAMLFPDAVCKNTVLARKRKQNKAMKGVYNMACSDMKWEIWGYLDASTKNHIASARYLHLFYKYMKYVYSACSLPGFMYGNLISYNSAGNRSRLVGPDIDRLIQGISTENIKKFVRLGTPGKYYKKINALATHTMYQRAYDHTVNNHCLGYITERWSYVYEIKKLIYIICEEIHSEPLTFQISAMKRAFIAVINSIVYVNYRRAEKDGTLVNDFGKVLL